MSERIQSIGLKTGIGLGLGGILLSGCGLSSAIDRTMANCGVYGESGDAFRAVNAINCAEVSFFTNDIDYVVAEDEVSEIESDHLRARIDLVVDKLQAAQAIWEAGVISYEDAEKRLSGVEDETVLAETREAISNMKLANEARVDHGDGSWEWYNYYSSATGIAEAYEEEGDKIETEMRIQAEEALIQSN